MFSSDTTTHILTLVSIWGSCFLQPVPLLGPTPSNRLVRTIFEPNLFPYKYPNNLTRLLFLCTPPMKLEQTRSETSAYKIQTPGNHTKERTQ